MEKRIQAIWAQAHDGVIGKDQTMPWHLPAELQHFKQTTLGQVILMGRVTFDGMGRRVLPGRTSLILTRDEDYEVADERVLVFHRVADVLRWYDEQEKSLFIIGGAQMISAFEPYLQDLVQTQIDADLAGDTYFPADFDWAPYEEVSQKFHAQDEKNPYDFTVHYYTRKDGD